MAAETRHIRWMKQARKRLTAVRIAVWTLGGLAAMLLAAWLLVLGFLYVTQRDLLYDNHREIERPLLKGDYLAGLPIEDVRIKTPDGETLQAWYQAPKPGRPVILFLHGQGASLNMGRYRYKRMADKGVGYLAVAYRGFSQSTGTPSERGLFTDGLAAYDWLRAKGVADSDIVIHGHSLGTGVATYVATQRQARALILEAPFTAASDVAQARYPFLPAAWLLRDKYLNRERIGQVHMPVLITHGTRDTVIPFAEGEALYARANTPKSFVAMPDSDHNTLTRDGVYEKYWAFLGVK